MMIYAWIALIALLFKGYWWFASKKYVWADHTWYFVMSCFLLQNLVELLGYHQLSQQIAPTFLIKVYYVTLSTLGFSIYCFVYDKQKLFQRILFYINSASLISLFILILFSELIIVGYLEGSFPIQSEKGINYSYFIYYALMCVFGSITALSINIFNSFDDFEANKKHLHALIALTPFFMVAISISFGLYFELNVNGSGLFPISSTLFLGLVILLRCRPSYLIESSIPLTNSNKLSRNIDINITDR